MSTTSTGKRRRVSSPRNFGTTNTSQEDEESTEVKLALLTSLHPNVNDSALMEALLIAEGSVDSASELLARDNLLPARKQITFHGHGHQTSLASFQIKNSASAPDDRRKRQLTKKGKTLHLYTPADIALHTPCSVIHNFLRPAEADALLVELLNESPTFRRERFQLFDRVVESPHTMSFYVDSWDEVQRQKTEYVYNGTNIADVRKSLPEMLAASSKVQAAVNEEIKYRIEKFYPGGRKLQFQSPKEWTPNAAFVNCYDGGAESVGYHSDQLTYLGPRAVIGSLSLGVAREFRVRKIIPRDDHDVVHTQARKDDRADAEGQISIHLPHNSLLVMHAEMQEEWKHSISPALAIDPHPIAKTKRINITYRHYKDTLHPRYTPKCKCGISTALRCVQRKKENRGKYMWMCHASYTPGKSGCSYFQWAEFDDDGEPLWTSNVTSESGPAHVG